MWKHESHTYSDQNATGNVDPENPLQESARLHEILPDNITLQVVFDVMTPPRTGPKRLAQAVLIEIAPEAALTSLNGTTSKTDAYASA